MQLRIIANDYIEFPVAFLGLPIALKKFEKEDGSFHTPLSYVETIDGLIIYNDDSTRAIMPFEMSHDDGDFEAMEKAIKNPQLGALFGGIQPVLLKGDLVSVEESIIRVLNYSKYQELLRVNPKWIFKEDEV